MMLYSLAVGIQVLRVDQNGPVTAARKYMIEIMMSRIDIDQ